MSDIFVSYAHEDKAKVRRLVKMFEAQGWSVWWDDLIDVGVKYAARLDEALAGSRCVVVCWSQASLQSEYVKSEAHRGDAKAALVQVMFEDVIIPSPFDEYVTANLTAWPDKEGGDCEAEKLIRDLSGRLTLSASSFPIDTSGYVPGFGGQPAVAVLPFQHTGKEEEAEYIADGLHADIIDRLQRFRSFPVISSITFSTIDLSKGPAAIAQQLGAQYLVSGTLRQVGKEYRLRIELVQAPSFKTIWSTTEKIRDFENSDIQDELSISIAAQLEPEIERSERLAALPVNKDKAEHWHLVRQGIWYQYQMRPESALKAHECFDLALKQNPRSVDALVHMAWWHFWRLSALRGTGDQWREPEELAKKASQEDPFDPRAITMMGISRMMRCEYEASRTFYRRALEQNPSHVWAYAHMGSSLYLDEQPEASIVHSSKALRLSPHDFFAFHTYCDIATSNYMLGYYDRALEAVEYSLSIRGGYWIAHMMKVCILSAMGQTDRARQAFDEMTQRGRVITRKDIEWIIFKDPARNRDLIEQMTAAGWSG
jgi:TolB-like protein